MAADCVKWIGVLPMLAAMLLVSTGEAVQFCDILEPVNASSVEMTFHSDRSPFPAAQSQCTCVLSARDAMLQVSMSLKRLGGSTATSEEQGQEQQTTPGKDTPVGNMSCEPFLAFRWGEPEMQLAQCAVKRAAGGGEEEEEDQEDDANFLLQLSDNAVRVTLHNHKKRQIRATVSITLTKGSAEINCFSTDKSDVWGDRTCPCEAKTYRNGYGAPPSGGRRRVGSDHTGLIVALVCVAIFLLILAIIGAIWWRRKKARAGREPDGVTSPNTAKDNVAYAPSTTASRSSGLDRAPDGSAPSSRSPGQTTIPFDPDPELNLSLQAPPQGKPAQHGTGPYNNVPQEKAPNNNYPYANVPLGPDQMYNPMLAKQPSTASLTGQGALHGSVDQLNPADVVYTPANKPNRRVVDPNPAPTRSASHDALNQRPPAENLQQARSRSHNASMSSMHGETDV